MGSTSEAVDVAVVGGGLAGLAAAAYLARAGRRVVLLEKARAVGGRAITQEERGFRFNLGPHALYRGGEALRVLEELGVRWSGQLAKPAGPVALWGDDRFPLPASPFSMLSSPLLPAAGKLEVVRLLMRLPVLDTAKLQATSVSAWLDGQRLHPRARAFVEAIIRVAMYSTDAARASAGVALEQLRRAFKGVYYLDGGWQSLVDGLRQVAVSSGAQIREGARVTAVAPARGGCTVQLDGERLFAEHAVLTGSPASVCELLGSRSPSLERFAREATPVRAATLDVGLSRLPRPDTEFALGLDRPIYCSVHSTAARGLAPEGGAMIHVAKYLLPGDTSEGVEAELERVLDGAQPGWRDAVVTRRFLPHLTVMHALVEARSGGWAGRFGVEMPEVPGVYVAGDWAAPTGLLADGTLASAKWAAEVLLSGRREAAVAAVG